MTFPTAQIRLDHWRKTSKIRAAKNGAVSREVADIQDPKGKKFAHAVEDIPNYVCVQNANVKGGVVIRRRKGTRVVKPIA